MSKMLFKFLTNLFKIFWWFFLDLYVPGVIPECRKKFQLKIIKVTILIEFSS